MNNLFLNVPRIGRLYIKETLVEYDFPLIFVCEDDYDSLYLFHETEETEDYLEWQAVKITRQSYHDILSSKISLNHVFIEKQPTPFLLIRYFSSNKKVEIEESSNLQCVDILDLEDTFLRDYTSSESDDLGLQIPIDSSEIELELYPGKAVDAIEANLHKNLCDPIESIVRNYGEKANYLSVKIGIPRSASYSIPIIISSSKADEIPAMKVANDLAKILNFSDQTDFDTIKNEKILSALGKFYKTIEKTKNDFVLTYMNEQTQVKSSSKIKYSEYEEKSRQISLLKNKLKEEKSIDKKELKIEGALIAFDIKKGSFKIKNSDDHEIQGSLRDELKEEKYVVGAQTKYSALLQEIDGEKYQLLSLEEIKEPDIFEDS